MAWTTIATTDIDQDSPITQPLMTAIRDNIIYAWQAAWHPYDMAQPGDGADGVIYDHAVDGTVASVVSPDFADGFEYRFLIDGISASTGSPSLQFEPYLATSATYEAAMTVATTTIGTDVVYGDLTLELPRRVANRRIARSVAQINTVETAPTVTVMSWYTATAQKHLRGRWSFTSGNIDAGTITMLRRRVEV